MNSRKLKVAMVVRAFSTSGGLELYAHKLVEGLLERGHLVTVICEENRSEFTNKSLSFHYFSGPKPGTNKANRLKHYFEAASLAVQQAGSFDIIHSQHLPMAGTNAVTFHNHSVHRLYKVGKPWENLVNWLKFKLLSRYQLRDQYDQQLLNDGNCLIFSAKVCRDDFYANYKLSESNKPSAVAYPGASLAETPKPCPEKNIFETVAEKCNSGNGKQLRHFDGKQPFTFVFVGRGYRKKGLDILLAACNILRKQGRLFHLVVAGIKLRPLDELRLRIMDLTGLITYLGFCKDMQSVYKLGQAIILPSRVEPFGMTALQGMAEGLTPIVSRVAGVSEIIENGKNGLILENHLSPTDLAKQMELLMSDRNNCRLMGEAARTVAQDLTWDQTVEDTLKAYEVVLQATKGQANQQRGLNDEVQSKSLN